jgi:hypothetical protein
MTSGNKIFREMMFCCEYYGTMSGNFLKVTENSNLGQNRGCP